jgi:lysophospholipase L1-like esterase
VVVNSLELRMDQDLAFPKKKPRILCLGDSFTFGPYLANHDTYPGLLQQKYPDKEVINAGICGYTITDEVSLLKQRAKYCEPDIIIFQALDNDLMDFFYFKRQVFARDRQDFKPTPPEEEYFARLQALEAKPAQASHPQ